MDSFRNVADNFLAKRDGDKMLKMIYRFDRAGCANIQYQTNKKNYIIDSDKDRIIA